MIEFDRLQLRLIDAEYRRRPCYGGRRMIVSLRAQGHPVNHQRLIRVLGLAGMAPGPQTSKPHPEHKVFPYRLRGLAITRPNLVWNTDITPACLAHGFAYRVAMLDGYSRRVLAWRPSNTLESNFCIDSLEGALRRHGGVEIFNTYQGSQFTSRAFTQVLQEAGARSTTSSSNGSGAASSMRTSIRRVMRRYPSSCPLGLTEYFAFYNGERPHQALGNRTPEEVHRTGYGGGGRRRLIILTTLQSRRAGQLKFGQNLSWTWGPLNRRLKQMALAGFRSGQRGQVRLDGGAGPEGHRPARGPDPRSPRRLAPCPCREPCFDAAFP